MYFFEAIMLICFGISWPISIYKSLVTRNVSGKSPLFMCIIITGYASGIVHKYLQHNNWIIWLYLLNMIMVSLDLYFYYRFLPKEKS
ncbi:MAG: hypothetical protein R6U84_06955 [Candidatus Cloacimonadales bacterium]